MSTTKSSWLLVLALSTVMLAVMLLAGDPAAQAMSETSLAYPWPYPPLGPHETQPEAFDFRCARAAVFTDIAPPHPTWYGWMRVRRNFDGAIKTYTLNYERYIDSGIAGINIWSAPFDPIVDGVYTWLDGAIMGHPVQNLPIMKWIICQRQFAPLTVREQSRERHNGE